MEILRFSASWCGPCKAMDKWLEENNLTDKIDEELDVDVWPDAVRGYGVRSVPTLIKVERGNVVDTFNGFDASSTDRLKEWLNDD